MSRASRKLPFQVPAAIRRRVDNLSVAATRAFGGLPWVSSRVSEPDETEVRALSASLEAPVPDEKRVWPEALFTHRLDAMLEVRAASCSKGEDHSEDAFGASGSRIAVADGASSSWEAGRWAQTLVDAWLASDRLDTDWLERARQHFAAATPKTDGSLGWLEDAAAQRGAHAAFIGVTFEVHDTELHWTAYGCGDVTAAVVAPSGVTAVFPDPAKHGFGSRPQLLSSLACEGEALTIDTYTAPLADDQCLLVMSDAVAEFVVTRAGGEVLEQLRCASIDTVAEMLTLAARSGHIEVDDLTVVRAFR